MNLSALAKLRADYDEALKAAAEPLRAEFSDIFKPFFDANSIVERIQIRAYTPYFADGDECVYSVQAPEFFVTGGDEDEGYGQDYGFEIVAGEVANYLDTGEIGRELKDSYTCYYYRDYPSVESFITGRYAAEIDLGLEKIREIAKAVSEWPAARSAFDAVPEDLFKEIFGDHVVVTVDRSGTTTDHYEHD